MRLRLSLTPGLRTTSCIGTLDIQSRVLPQVSIHHAHQVFPNAGARNTVCCTVRALYLIGCCALNQNLLVGLEIIPSAVSETSCQ
jgi:hypothetical protein